MAALIVVVIAAAGGYFVRELYRQPPTHKTVQEEPTQPSTPVPVDQQPGSGQVKARQEFAEHPLQGQIWPMLQAHFDSINHRDYQKWRSTVTRERAVNFPEQKWLEDYRTTRDGSILVHRIDSAPDRKLRVMVSFTSTQDIVDAPPELPKECIRWHIVLPLTREDNKWKIDIGPEGSSPRHEECGAAPSVN
ncbi:hypothetical protein [Kibdelosporangium phytohabitans]|uniref:Uncharacterized protein n=1 Tax=Kibdelosporangium phytohabitans TaxID=860235 RepID=A0A0N9HRU2_9PSEU|nr:hypothetical protein [Kibdelosporangium phytohabitans]ALG07612.1 hypothetical protein AOZ06_12475 [Kibdelosporangium phytohabitans]MBE1471440.1 hypothetical protein [Kibdelosporangium phytohabitans]